MRQAVHREPALVGLLLQREHHRLAAAVGPLHQQRSVQSPEPASEVLLQLLLSNREEGRLLVGFRRLVEREERERLTRVLDDEVLEVLVVADRFGHVRTRVGIGRMIGQTPPRTLWAMSAMYASDRKKSA